MTTSRTGNDGGARGFTFIEMLVVLLLISAMLAVAAPAFQRTQRQVRSRSAARLLMASINYAHQISVMRGRQARVAMNLRNKTFWIETRNERGGFEKLLSSEARERTLPEDTVVEPQPEPDSDAYFITFFPDGTAEPRAFRVIDKNENTSMFMEVHPATGNVAVKQN